MNRTLLFTCSALALSLTGCGGGRPTAPAGPSDDITLAASPSGPIITTTITCSGPAGEIAALGALCASEGSASAFHRIATPLSAIARIDASSGRGPYLLLVGFAPAGTPDDGQLHDWDAAAVRHAAFLVMEDRSVDVISALEAYDEGIPLTGELVTTHLDNGACSTGWSGAGTLRVGEVTIALTWTSTIPC